MATVPQLVISQVYGGGGNSGATLKNDFIKIFNPGQSAVNVTGYSVKYASATGTTWQVTNLSGSIPAGGYYSAEQIAVAGVLRKAMNGSRDMRYPSIQQFRADVERAIN